MDEAAKRERKSQSRHSPPPPSRPQMRRVINHVYILPHGSVERPSFPDDCVALIIGHCTIPSIVTTAGLLRVLNDSPSDESWASRSDFRFKPLEDATKRQIHRIIVLPLTTPDGRYVDYSDLVMQEHTLYVAMIGASPSLVTQSPCVVGL